MASSRVDQVARAVLYEGYLLYPYRPSSVKNRQRWTVGAVYPEPFARLRSEVDAWLLRADCLIEADPSTPIDVHFGFLQMAAPRGGEAHPDWREAVERRIDLDGRRIGDLIYRPARREFVFSQPEGGGPGTVRGWVEARAIAVRPGRYRVVATIANTSPVENAGRATHSDVQPFSLVSAHAILESEGGAFVSMIDPGLAFRDDAAACENLGLWPVLAGEEGARSAMLAASIILYDYPRVAPESPGDLFDATEIDEVLSLRILTLTDAEKREMAAFDDRARSLLARTEGLDQTQLMGLHAVMKPTVPSPGDRVILRPRRRADAFDLILAGQAATVASVECDFEDQTYVTVLVDDDPGKDLGAEGKPGHRFFFRADEVEPIPRENGAVR